MIKVPQELLDIPGRKDDSGKPPMSLISRRAQVEEAKVLAFGKEKYDAWNWSLGIKWSRVLDAVLRHVTAYCDGETYDPESGLSHLAHARCGLGFLLDYEESHPELDDRRPRGDSKNLSDVQRDLGRHSLQTPMPQLPLFSKLQ